MNVADQETAVLHNRVEDSSSQVRVRLVEDLQSVRSMSEEWNALALESGSTIFQTNEWLSLWWEFFGSKARARLHVIAWYRDSRLTGVAPFFTDRVAVGGVTICRRLRFLGSGISVKGSRHLPESYGPSDYLDIIALPGFEREMCDLIVSHIQSVRPSIDMVDLSPISDRGLTFNYLIPRLNEQGIQCMTTREDVCPFLQTPVSLDRYLASKSAHVRRRLQQAAKSWLPGGIRDVSSSAGTVREGLDRLIALHQQRWNSAGYPGLFCDRRFTDFSRAAAEAFRKRGWMWFKEIRSGETVVASRLAFRFGGTMYDYLSGFDSASPDARRRPGLALIVELVRSAIGERLGGIDFLRGDESYKGELTDDRSTNWRLVFALSPLNSLRKIVFHMSAGFWSVVQRFARERLIFSVHLRTHRFPVSILRYASFWRGRIIRTFNNHPSTE